MQFPQLLVFQTPYSGTRIRKTHITRDMHEKYSVNDWIMTPESIDDFTHLAQSTVHALEDKETVTNSHTPAAGRVAPTVRRGSNDYRVEIIDKSDDKPGYQIKARVRPDTTFTREEAKDILSETISIVEEEIDART